MINKFDLERFKAGEAAFDNEYELWYIETLPNGEIAYRWHDRDEDTWGASSGPITSMKDWTMKPKEEWVYLPKSFDIYPTKKDAENAFGKHIPSMYEAVKIIRE